MQEIVGVAGGPGVPGGGRRGCLGRLAGSLRLLHGGHLELLRGRGGDGCDGGRLLVGLLLLLLVQARDVVVHQEGVGLQVSCRG